MDKVVNFEIDWELDTGISTVNHLPKKADESIKKVETSKTIDAMGYYPYVKETEGNTLGIWENT